MKTPVIKFLTFGLIVLLWGCESSLGLDQSDLLPNDSLPGDTQSFIEELFPSYTIRKVKSDDICDDIQVYEVELEDGQGPDTDLYFDRDWTLLFSAVDIRLADLPEEVIRAVEDLTNYRIVEDDLEKLIYPDSTIRFKLELELQNGEDDRDLIVETDGTILCMESDGDDSNDYSDDDSDDSGDDSDDSDDDSDDSDDDSTTYTGNIPQAALDFIQDNYVGYRIDSYEKEDICEDEYYYEVELEDGPGKDIDLYFSLDWVFQFEMIEIRVDDLPQAVRNTIEEQYGAYEIEKDDLYKLSWEDGRIQYEVELDGNSDPEIIFNEDGTIDCIDD